MHSKTYSQFLEILDSESPLNDTIALYFFFLSLSLRMRARRAPEGAVIVTGTEMSARQAVFDERKSRKRRQKLKETLWWETSQTSQVSLVLA
ncbi:hypothetical protein BaRGS_00004114 [Batillaria attramentaria]|uniref:Uncharacterized protein n=1 Tax=Batillaria attramentaria TaxID=370345 RepID=A0ABD0LZR7_9CAEN